MLPLPGPHVEEAHDASTSLSTHSQATSETSLVNWGNSRPPLFGKARVRVSPALNAEEADDTTNSTTSGRYTPDVFISNGVAVEKASGEKIVEVEEDNSATNAGPIEVPFCVDHQPYIPLQSAKDALTRVCE